MTTPKPSSTPELSVIVVVLAGGTHTERCLRALGTREGVPDVEIVVPYDDRRPETAELRRKFSEVRWVRCAGRRTCAELRAAGVRESRAAVVAVTEDQCIPPAPWCRNVLAAHQASYAAIGGPVEKQEPDTALNWAIYLRELGSYMPPMGEGPVHQLTDCNVTYKRAALDTIALLWAESFHEPQVHGALEARGQTLWLSNSLLTYQQRTLELGPALAERYEFGRLYGSMRVAKVSIPRRLLMVAAASLLPLLLTARVYATVFGKGRHIAAALRAAPYLLLFATVWAWGELLGYLTGRPPAAWDPARRAAPIP